MIRVAILVDGKSTWEKVHIPDDAHEVYVSGVWLVYTQVTATKSEVTHIRLPNAASKVVIRSSDEKDEKDEE